MSAKMEIQRDVFWCLSIRFLVDLTPHEEAMICDGCLAGGAGRLHV